MRNNKQRPTGRFRAAGLGLSFLAVLALAGAVQACKNPLAEGAQLLKEVTASPLAVVAAKGGTGLGNGQAFDFGERSINDPPVTQLFTVTNGGKSTLLITAKTIVGTDESCYGFVGSPLASIAPKASATFSISFLPGTAGNKTASAVLTTNDVSNPTYTIGLTGTGINSAPMPALAGGNFQYVPSGPATVTLSCSNGSATIHYTTNGTTPSELSTQYTGTFYPTFSGTLTLKAMAVAPGYSNSAIMTATFSQTATVAPSVNLANQTFLSGPDPKPRFVLSDTDASASIVFTIDGTEPNPDAIATVISGGSNPTVSDGGTYFLANGGGFYAAHAGGSLNLRAKAFTTTGTVNLPSTEITASYQFKLSPPSFSTVQPSATYYSTAQSVTLGIQRGATGTAIIHYSTAAAVTNADPQYSAAIPVPAGAPGSSNTVTIQAMATQANWLDSDTLTGVFNICGPGKWDSSNWDQAAWQ